MNASIWNLAGQKQFTWNLSDFKKRRPCRLPSGMRTTSVITPSLSDGGSDGNDACLVARLDSSSYLHTTYQEQHNWHITKSTPDNDI
jgi:hypothetical protein